MSNLEQRMAAAEDAGADRDVADYRAEMRSQTKLINALRTTQVEQGADLAEVKAAVADLPEMKAGIRHIVQLIEGLGRGGSS